MVERDGIATARKPRHERSIGDGTNQISNLRLRLESARLRAAKGVDRKTYSLADVRGPKGLLVVFICNHCPYVKASIGRIVAEARALREIEIGTIAIMPNDTATYRENSSTI